MNLNLNLNLMCFELISGTGLSLDGTIVMKTHSSMTVKLIPIRKLLGSEGLKD
jgi:hypothetical protein